MAFSLPLVEFDTILNVILPPTLLISLLSSPCDRSIVTAVSCSVVYFKPRSFGGSLNKGVNIVSNFDPHVDHSTWPIYDDDDDDDDNDDDDDDDDDNDDSNDSKYLTKA